MRVESYSARCSTYSMYCEPVTMALIEGSGNQSARENGTSQLIPSDSNIFACIPCDSELCWFRGKQRRTASMRGT